MQPVFAVEPELDPLRGDAYPPQCGGRGTSRRPRSGRASPRNRASNVLAIGERARWSEAQGAKLGVAPPAGEIGVRLGSSTRGDWPLDADLAAQRLPVKQQSGLAALRPDPAPCDSRDCVEHESGGIMPLQQDHANRGLATRIDRRQRHRVGIVDFRSHAPRQKTRSRTGQMDRQPCAAHTPVGHENPCRERKR